MVGTNLKLETLSLKEKRDAIELEMNSIISRLTQPGGPGISGSLVDAEGFPRADIDIPAVRGDRRRLVELRNDHKDITEKINENLQILHSARLSQSVSFPTKDSANGEGSNSQVTHHTDASASLASVGGISENGPSAMDIEPVIRVPFAMIDEIADASPAAEDGLQLGDQIVKFGNVEIGGDLLPRLASEAQLNQGSVVPVVILRQGSVINLPVTPRPWHGRGLLGYAYTLFPCHLFLAPK